MDNHPTLITLHEPDFLVTLMPTHEGPLGGLVEPVVAARTANFALQLSDDRTRPRGRNRGKPQPLP